VEREGDLDALDRRRQLRQPGCFKFGIAMATAPMCGRGKEKGLRVAGELRKKSAQVPL
jgi:hypothetical protein